MAKVVVLGAGNFGFALTYHLDRKQDPAWQVALYARNPELVAHIQTTRAHPQFFPTTELSAGVAVTADLAAAVDGASVIVLAVASTGVRPVLAQLQPLITAPVTIVSIIKALDQQMGGVITDVIREELAGLPVTVAALGGGTTGTGLTQEQYLGATLACEDGAALVRLQGLLASPYLRIQTSSDVRGVQYAGALKNLISVLVGLVKGLGFAYGMQTHALSLAAAECERFATVRGARHETFEFASQCWGNDMVMSATDPDTRNHQLGVLLGEGWRFGAAVEKLRAAGKTAESANTLALLAGQRLDLSATPLLAFLVALSREQVAANDIVKLIETYV